MATNSPSSPIEATRNASMMAAVMAAHDREKAHNSVDERERDRMDQEERATPQTAPGKRPGFLRCFRDRLPFG